MARRVPQLEDLPDPAGQRVLLRADFNVPLSDRAGGADGAERAERAERAVRAVRNVVDDLRIRAAMPTIRWLLDAGAHVTACSHLGRPKGAPDRRYTMEPVRRRLAELAPEVEVMENLRFDPGEEANDEAFVDKLVKDQDLYVNDAFGAAHRAHASIVGPPARLPSASGRLLAREVDVLSGLLDQPARPFIAVLGGAKVSDKLGVIEALLRRVDAIVVGGGMCFTFLRALGHGTGDSLVETDQVDACRRLLDAGNRILLPSDIVALGPGGEIGKPDAGGEVRQVGRTVPDGWRGLDIGPGTAAEFTDEIGNARTVLWNGPMGVYEDPRFRAGTATVAHAVAEARGFTVVGGGDSAAALADLRLDGDVDHLSTGGGASLEFLEKGDLPGLAALREAPNARQP